MTDDRKLRTDSPGTGHAGPRCLPMGRL